MILLAFLVIPTKAQAAVPLAAPAGTAGPISATLTASGSLTVSWGAPADGPAVDGYQLFNGDSEELCATTAPVTTCTISLRQYGRYALNVRAVSQGTSGPRSSVVEVYRSAGSGSATMSSPAAPAVSDVALIPPSWPAQNDNGKVSVTASLPQSGVAPANIVVRVGKELTSTYFNGSTRCPNAQANIVVSGTSVTANCDAGGPYGYGYAIQAQVGFTVVDPGVGEITSYGRGSVAAQAPAVTGAPAAVSVVNAQQPYFRVNAALPNTGYTFVMGSAQTGSIPTNSAIQYELSGAQTYTCWERSNTAQQPFSDCTRWRTSLTDSSTVTVPIGNYSLRARLGYYTNQFFGWGPWSDTTSVSVTGLQVTVTLNPGFPAGGAAQQISESQGGSPISLPAPPSRRGFTFTGWFDAASGGSRVGGTGDTVPATQSRTLFAQWRQDSLLFVDPSSLVRLGTLTASGSVTSSYAGSAGTSDVQVNVPAGSLPPNTTVVIDHIQDLTTVSTPTGAGQALLALVVSWVAADGTVPSADLMAPIEVRIQEPSIRRGASVYAIIAGRSTVVGTAQIDGLITAELTEDPQVVIANPPLSVEAPTSGSPGSNTVVPGAQAAPAGTGQLDPAQGVSGGQAASGPSAPASGGAGSKPSSSVRLSLPSRPGKTLRVAGVSVGEKVTVTFSRTGRRVSHVRFVADMKPREVRVPTDAFKVVVRTGSGMRAEGKLPRASTLGRG